MFRLNWLVVAFCVGLAPSAFGLSINIDPTTQDVVLGDQASVDVVLGQPGGVFVGTYDIALDYDPAVLALNAVNFGTGLGGIFDSLQDSISSVGSVAVAELSLLFDLSGSQSGMDDFVLFTLVFDTLALGSSAVALSNVIVGDDFGLPLVAQLNSGGVNVVGPIIPGPTPVPAPDTLLLLLAGGLALLRTRFKTSKHAAEGVAR